MLPGWVEAGSQDKQKEFYRLTKLRDYGMDFQTIEEAFFASLASTPDLTSIATGVADTIVFTSSNRVAIQDIDQMAVELLPGFAQQMLHLSLVDNLFQFGHGAGQMRTD